MHTHSRRALIIAPAILGLAISLAGCPGTSQDPNGSKKPSAPANQDCGYSWKPCPSGNTETMATAPAPETSTYHSIYDSDTPAASPSQVPPDHQQSATWGDMKFGDCSISLWPAGIGLGVVRHFYPLSQPQEENGTQSAVYGEASSVCVGFQPKQFIIHIHLEQWSNLKKGSPATWHDAPGGPHDQPVIASSALPPIGVINPLTGQPPFSMQRIYHVWTPCIAGATVTYRLQIDIVGISYGGSPIVGGGVGATWTSLPDAC